ncbi:hypothetical protein GWI33_014267 [Rhynchophorus ferrugineus]|uniref:Uncharacterized protein n=1 Tax=Rhynchophorus ferrugineus TaxID=354439 RepID=A0A834I6H3_RHYFE|nr:hypothetical protein GWI33_014267 [Rhynchophorus ferrugineus]
MNGEGVEVENKQQNWLHVVEGCLYIGSILNRFKECYLGNLKNFGFVFRYELKQSAVNAIIIAISPTLKGLPSPVQFAVCVAAIIPPDQGQNTKPEKTIDPSNGPASHSLAASSIIFRNCTFYESQISLLQHSLNPITFVLGSARWQYYRLGAAAEAAVKGLAVYRPRRLPPPIRLDYPAHKGAARPGEYCTLA